jgi:hypothetical protein
MQCLAKTTDERAWRRGIYNDNSGGERRNPGKVGNEYCTQPETMCGDRLMLGRRRIISPPRRISASPAEAVD